LCPRCLSAETNWIPVDARGTLWSFAVYHRAYNALWRDYLPYFVGLIDLDAGITLVSQVLQSGPLEIGVGKRVVGKFIDVDDELTVLKFVTEDGS
jgi:hypothetical protein